MKLALVYLLFLLPFAAPFASGADETPVSQNNGHVLVKQNTHFANRLKLVAVEPGPQEASHLRTVGQMLALANPSGGLEGKGISWVELDATLSRSLDLPLAASSRVGRAFGMTLVSAAYADQIHPKERVEIFRYGLRSTNTQGWVLSVLPIKGMESQLRVVIELKDGLNWYPGTNCEIEFPLISSMPQRVPVTALLHEGLQEYVMKETAPGDYFPEAVTVSGETADSVYVLGNLKPGERIIGEGAILIKPLLREFLVKKETDPNAP